MIYYLEGRLVGGMKIQTCKALTGLKRNICWLLFVFNIFKITSCHHPFHNKGKRTRGPVCMQGCVKSPSFPPSMSPFSYSVTSLERVGRSKNGGGLSFLSPRIICLWFLDC